MQMIPFWRAQRIRTGINSVLKSLARWCLLLTCIIYIVSKFCQEKTTSTSKLKGGSTHNQTFMDIVAELDPNHSTNKIKWHPDNRLLTILQPQPAPIISDESLSISKQLRSYLCLDQNEPGKYHDETTGAFCINPESPHRYHTLTDLCHAVEDLLPGKEIADFGTGYGYLGRCLLRSEEMFLPPWGTQFEEDDFFKPMISSGMWDKPKKIKSWTGYEGIANIEEVTSNFVQFFDLTKPRFLGRIFDWVICFEVGEHIPPKYERIFFENLIRHAREGILLSWALPCENCPWTVGHVNEQPNWYVAQRMAPYGFEWDEEKRKVLSAGAGMRENSVMAFKRVTND